MKPKGFTNLIIIIAVLVALSAIASTYLVLENQKIEVIPEGRFCTMDAKQCPDGSYVGRTGSNCEFSSCPAVVVDTSTWKTYRNEQYGFELVFNDAWKNYKVINVSPTTFEFYLPSKLPGPGNLKDYALMFFISVLSHKDWAELLAEDGPKSSFLNENSNYVFVYNQAQDTTDELYPRYLEISQILSTFKFIPAATSVDTSAWKTHLNAEWGFELKYPPDFYVNEGMAKRQDKFTSARIVNIYDSVDNRHEFSPSLGLDVMRQPFSSNGKMYTSLTDLANDKTFLFEGVVPKKILINGAEALTADFDINDPVIERNRSIVLLHQGLIYSIIFDREHRYFDDIAKTFRFISK